MFSTGTDDFFVSYANVCSVAVFVCCLKVKAGIYSSYLSAVRLETAFAENRTLASSLQFYISLATSVPLPLRLLLHSGTLTHCVYHHDVQIQIRNNAAFSLALARSHTFGTRDHQIWQDCDNVSTMSVGKSGFVLDCGSVS